LPPWAPFLPQTSPNQTAPVQAARRSLSKGAIAGISVGGAFGLGLIGALVFMLLRNHRRLRALEEQLEAKPRDTSSDGPEARAVVELHELARFSEKVHELPQLNGWTHELPQRDQRDVARLTRTDEREGGGFF
jgi:hypothetical protein